MLLFKLENHLKMPEMLMNFDENVMAMLLHGMQNAVQIPVELAPVNPSQHKPI